MPTHRKALVFVFCLFGTFLLLAGIKFFKEELTSPMAGIECLLIATAAITGFLYSMLIALAAVLQALLVDFKKQLDIKEKNPS